MDDVWAGANAPDQVVVESEVEGQPFKVEWREPGTQVVAFLWLKRDSESARRFYRPIAQDGIVLLSGDLLLRSVNDSDLATDILGLPLGDAKSLITNLRSG